MAGEPITNDELAAMLQETGHHHHQSYIEAEGVDPEWALWYAGYLQARLWDRLGRLPTRSELVYLLVGADKALTASGRPNDEWPGFYAEFIRQGVTGAS